MSRRRRVCIANARLCPGVFFLLLTLVLAGCATPQTDRLRASASVFPKPVELDSVPFFPQTDYYCGPAALATVLEHAGATATPDQLAPQVYLPERQGSLQVEMLGAARRAGRVPYVLRPELESILAEVTAGNPVLVLQNLAFGWQPVWHYAVVVGFDLPSNILILRSGTERRLRTPIDVFERTWARGHYWAVVAMSPTQLPFTAEELPYLTSVTSLERLGLHAQSAQAYAAALKRWPRSLGAYVGLGNSRYALGDLAGAESAFRQAVHYHPGSAAALNNLAQTLADRGELEEALRFAQRAVAIEPHNAIFRQTLDAVDAARSKNQ